MVVAGIMWLQSAQPTGGTIAGFTAAAGLTIASIAAVWREWSAKTEDRRSAQPALRADRKSVASPYVIAEFAHDLDLSMPTTDSDRFVATQNASVRTVAGMTYPASTKMWSNAGDRGNSVIIRGVDAWEQKQW